MMDYPAKALFQEFLDGGFERIQKALEPAEFEDRFIEYKGPRQEGKPKDHVDRAAVAKEASAFANADGGIIVWGIEDKGKDAVRELSPIPNIVEFVQRLNDLANNLLDPPLMGIDSRVIHGDGGLGYAVTLIPNGAHKPYASLGSCCYMRVGSNAHPMPMNIVRAMMFESARPELALVVNDFKFQPSVKKTSMGGVEHPTIRYVCTLNVELYNKGIVAVDSAAIGMPWDGDPSHWKFKASEGIGEEVVRRREKDEPGYALPARFFRSEGSLYPQTSKPLLQIVLTLMNERDLEELTEKLSYSVYTSHLTEHLKFIWPADLMEKFLQCRAQHDNDLRSKGLDAMVEEQE